MSKIIRSIVFVMLIGALLAACSPAKSDPAIANPYAPQSGDASLVRDTIRIDSAAVVRSAGTPAATTLELAYFLPTPCHQFRLAVSEPDASGRISVDAYSLRKAEQVCNLMALATPSTASLGFGSLPDGKYTVWVNGSMAGEVTLP